MWFVFPQLRRPRPQRDGAFDYGISSRAEAVGLSGPSAARRASGRVHGLIARRARRRATLETLGSPDDLKLRSSMTLFGAVAAERALTGAADRRRASLGRFFDGATPTPATLRLSTAAEAASTGARGRRRPTAEATMRTCLSSRSNPSLAHPCGSATSEQRDSSVGLLDILQQYSRPGSARRDRRRREATPTRSRAGGNRRDLGNGVAAAFRSDCDAAVRTDDRRSVRPLRSAAAPASSTRSSTVASGAGGLASAGGVLGRVLGGAGTNAAPDHARGRRPRSRRRTLP